MHGPIRWSETCGLGRWGLGFIVQDERKLCGAWMVRLLLVRWMFCVWIPTGPAPRCPWEQL